MKSLFANKMRVSFVILGSLLILFIAWPLLRTVTASSPATLWQTLLDDEVRGSIALTFYSSLIATSLAFVCGVPLAYLLARADFDRPIAFLTTGGTPPAQGEALLDYYADLGGPHGYVVSISTPAEAHHAENRRLLAQAGMILLGDGDGLSLAQTLPATPALTGIGEAFASGALVVGRGEGGVALGELLVTPQGTAPGWGWIEGAIVTPRFAGAAAHPALQTALRANPHLVGIGIAVRSGLALGPEGQVEALGYGEVTIVVTPTM